MDSCSELSRLRAGGNRSKCVLGLLLLCSLTLRPAYAAELDCLVEPWSEVTVSAAIEGVVEEVVVDRGDRVHANQVVARLESNVEKATIEMAKARYESQGRTQAAEAQLRFTERSLTRQLNLQEQDVVSESEMDQSRSSKEIAIAELQMSRDETLVAKHELARARAALARRTIRSPVNGVVVERILSPGEYADPPQIMRLAQLDPLRVEVFAPLDHHGRIDLGMEVPVRFEEPVGGRHMATVVVVDQVIDAASGTFGVRLKIPNPSLELPAGLKCRAEFP